MTSTQCNIGELRKAADAIVTLTITCLGEETTKSQMIEAVKAIDSIAEKPSPLLVDASQSHSVSFDALIEMAKATNPKISVNTWLVMVNVLHQLC